MDSDCYRLIEPRPLGEVMPAWEPHFPQYDTVRGYSELGHVFLRDSATRAYAVLHPYEARAESYGRFLDLDDFITDVLLDRVFTKYVLRPPHVAQIRRLLGPLAEGEVYIAAPYPFLGGSEEPDAYMKGDLWVFLDLVAQSVEF
ncbi:T6SS immunity protein Tdi1 domain-containing protein [Nocardia sp. NPDC048505]|uniref:T6SS immunity protein Tdi1 domain-containing protein n=1 Tax=Nocardia sp. NPDC048505 TaxID=3155756 RepID=UPI0033DC77EE